MVVQVTCLSLMLLLVMYLPAWSQTPRRDSGISEQDVDLYVNSWKNNPARTENGALEVRDILTAADDPGASPLRKGAVLTRLRGIRFGLLRHGASTDPAVLEHEQQVLYIVGGNGEITAGRQSERLFEGVGVIIPPGLEYTITAIGAEPLMMYIIAEPIPPGFVPRRSLLARNAYDNPISSGSTNSDSSSWLFSINDGLSTAIGINPVMFEPRALFPPHVHPRDSEEVWICLSGDMEFVIGNTRRVLPVGSAYRAPSDEITPHMNLNSATSSRRMLWIMVVPYEPAAGSPDSVM